MKHIIITILTLLSISLNAQIRMNTKQSFVDSTRLNATGDSLYHYQNGVLISTEAITIGLDSGVTGTLPIANGGTGSTTQNFVDLTTTQTISGAKTFTSDLEVNGKIALSVGNENVVIGDNAGASLISGQGLNNVLVGIYAGAAIDSGDYNVGFGHQALFATTTGYSNLANGFRSLYSNTTGYNNVANGTETLYFNETGYNNIANGFRSLRSNKTGDGNVANGAFTLFNLSSGSDNQAYGYQAGRYYGSGTSSLTTANGSLFLGSNTRASADGNSNEIVIGTDAIGNGSNSVTIGNDGTIGTATSKVVLNGALTQSGGDANFDSGTLYVDESLNFVGIGTILPENDLHVKSSTGSLKFESLNGGANIFMESADNNTTRIRWNSNSNFAIRNDSTASDVLTINQSGNVGIATGIASEKLDVNGNARFRIVGSGTYSLPLNITSNGTLTTATSDIRYKTNLNLMPSVLHKLLNINTYTFNWLSDLDKVDAGMVAQEVEQYFPLFTFTNKKDGIKGIDYAKFTTVLTKAIQEQQTIIETQASEIDQLKTLITDLTNRIQILENK